jgi:hypothetical protein
MVNKKVKELSIGDRIDKFGLVIRLMPEDHKGYKNHRRVTCSDRGGAVTYTWHNDSERTVYNATGTVDDEIHANFGDRHSGWSV